MTATAPSTSPAKGSLRDLWAIIAALTFVQTAVAATGFVIPLLLSGNGQSSFVIGLVTACYMIGFLAGARLAPARIGIVGHVRAFALFGAAASLACLCLYVSFSPFWTALVELLLGISVAALFATGESWVTDAAPEESRGRVLSIYYLFAKLGTMAGPFVVSFSVLHTGGAFMLLAGLFCAAILPITITRQVEPDPPSAAPFGIRDLWRAAPASVQAAFAAGAANGAVLQLYPIYMLAITPGVGEIAIAAFNGIAQIGALLVLWPAGSWSDRADRRNVIAVLAALGALASLSLGLLGAMLPVWLLLGLAALWGAGSLNFYGIAVAHAADRAGPGQGPKAIAGMLMVWASGAATGPVIAGLLMSVALGPSGLFAVPAVLLGLLSLSMLLRQTVSGKVAPNSKGTFAPISTTSMGIADLDARAKNRERRTGPGE